MFDALKPLLDSGIVNEETKTEIQEAWETKLNETREEIRGELRDEFSRRYEHDKTTMVESLDKMVNENLTKELEKIAEERKALEEDRVKFNVKMNENTDKVKNFMLSKLGAELSELNEDRKVQAETLDKLQKFVVKALAEEIAEFHKDKEAVVETRVKLVAEGKKQLDESKKDAETKSTLVESKEAEIRKINDRIVRDQKLNEMMNPLSKDQKTVMQDLLENVITDKLDATFNKYLPAVLKNEVKADSKKSAIMESKEVTGNKKESVNAEDEGNIIEIKRLAGLN